VCSSDLGQNVPPAFRDAAFGIDTVGGISDVVRTRFGYHIVRLLEREDRPSLEEVYESIEERVRQMPRMKRRMSVVAEDILAQRDVSVDTSAILAAAYPNAGQTALDSLARPLARLTRDTDTGAIVATVGSTQRTREDLAAFLQANQESRQLPIRDAITDFLHDTALDVAAQDLEKTAPSFRRKMQEYRDGLLLFEYMQREVWTPAAQDSAALRSFFKENRDDYRFPERVRALRLVAPHDSLLAPYTGVSVDEATTRAKNDSLLSATMLYVSEDTDAPANRVMQVSNGESVGPVSIRGEAGRALFIRAETEDPRPMTFEEARSRVIRDYQDHYEGEVLDDLRSRYDIETYPSNLPDPSR